MTTRTVDDLASDLMGVLQCPNGCHAPERVVIRKVEEHEEYVAPQTSLDRFRRRSTGARVTAHCISCGADLVFVVDADYQDVVTALAERARRYQDKYSG